MQVMFHALMTSSMTSPGHKVGQILKVIYLGQYFVYSTSGITSGKKVCHKLKIVAILKILKY